MIKILKNKQFKKIISSVVLIFLLSLIFAVPAFATKCEDVLGGKNKNIRLQVYLPMPAIQNCDQASYELNEEGQFVPATKKVYYIENIQAYISGMFTLSIGVVALGAIVVIMLGGFQYVWAAGNQQKISSAKSMISGALGGLALVLLSYGLLNTINPQITSLQIKKVNPVAEVSRLTLCDEEFFKDKMFSPLELDPPKFDVEQKDTKCGYPYYIKGGAGNSCMGAICPTRESCVNGNCTLALIHGSIEFLDPDRYVVSVGLLGICKKDGEMRQFDATDRVDIYIPTESGDYAIEDEVEYNFCDDRNLAKYMVSVEINDPGFFTNNNEYYQVAPPKNGTACDQAIKTCANDEGTHQKPPKDDGTCPAGYENEVIRPLRMKLYAKYNHPYLWTQAEIINITKDKVCNIIINDTFPEDYGE